MADSEHRHEGTIVIARPAEAIYDMVAEVTRMGEWSPVCTACWWDDGAGAQPGSWFTGRNEFGGRVYDTRCMVVVADRAREFTFDMGGTATSGPLARWRYTFSPVQGGTEVTESWDLLHDGVRDYHERFGADFDAQVAERVRRAESGIRTTLAAIKEAAEAA